MWRLFWWIRNCTRRFLSRGVSRNRNKLDKVRKNIFVNIFQTYSVQSKEEKKKTKISCIYTLHYSLDRKNNEKKKGEKSSYFGVQNNVIKHEEMRGGKKKKKQKTKKFHFKISRIFKIAENGANIRYQVEFFLNFQSAIIFATNEIVKTVQCTYIQERKNQRHLSWLTYINVYIR